MRNYCKYIRYYLINIYCQLVVMLILNRFSSSDPYELFVANVQTTRLPKTRQSRLVLSIPRHRHRLHNPAMVSCLLQPVRVESHLLAETQMKQGSRQYLELHLVALKVNSTPTQNFTGPVGQVTPWIYWSYNIFTGPTNFSLEITSKKIHRQHLFLFYLHLFQKQYRTFTGGDLLTRMSPNVYWPCRTI